MNKYFTVEPVYKKASKDEYQKFIDEYPRKLVRDVYGVCDPPSITYNDFELADRYPYSVVASTFAYDDEPGAYYYEPPEERIYKIMENYKEVFDRRTGYKEDVVERNENPPHFVIGELKWYPLIDDSGNPLFTFTVEDGDVFDTEDKERII